MSNYFKKKYPLEERKNESLRVSNAYPDRVPIIVMSDDKLNISKFKFMVPNDISVGQFLYIVKKGLSENDSTKSLFILFNNVIPCHSDKMSDMNDRFRDEDGFLYAYVSYENTFG